MADSELCFHSIAALAQKIAARDVSPVEVLDALLERIGQLNGTLNAYLHVDADGAREAARAAETAITQGNYLGPLHGIPIAHKDIFHVRGLPTTAGSRLMGDFVPDSDCVVAARLRDAGAVCVGKLNTLEFASGSMEVFGTARNPWHTDRHPSGSSSGSGVALAAHMVHGASGSDTGGSVRLPAAACGVVGLKPTYGRVSRSGILPLSWSLDHPGPMARTVGDVALLLQAMAGPDPTDSTTTAAAAKEPVPDYSTSLTGDIKGLRIGVPNNYFFDDADPEVIGAVRNAVALLEELGAEVHEVTLPWSAYSSAASWTVAYTESYVIHRDRFFARARDYTPTFFHKIAGAACLSAEQQLTAARVRERVTAEFVEALQTVDALVMPTTPYTAHPIAGPNPQAETHSLTRATSLTGLPSLSLPCGFAAGLPVSLQLTGRAFDEATLLRLGHAYEQAAGWFKQRAPIAVQPDAPVHPAAQALESAVDAEWILDYARLHGLSFITAEDAEPIAASIGPQMTQLAMARERLDDDAEPALRPAPV